MDLLAYVAIFLAAAVIAVPLSRRFGLGSVLGYLAAGVALGPFGLGGAGGSFCSARSQFFCATTRGLA